MFTGTEITGAETNLSYQTLWYSANSYLPTVNIVFLLTLSNSVSAFISRGFLRLGTKKLSFFSGLNNFFLLKYSCKITCA